MIERMLVDMLSKHVSPDDMQKAGTVIRELLPFRTYIVNSLEEIKTNQKLILEKLNVDHGNGDIRTLPAPEQ